MFINNVKILPDLISRVFVYLSLLLALSAPVQACDFDDEDGLDVGLVLSGGGAKASTQVGVMQLMDELGIPIHCITGTSMGAVVGAFYASGYTANDIADIFIDNDWGALFRNETPRRAKPFIEKEREEEYFSGNVLGINQNGISLPGGLNSMHGLKSFYRDILWNIPLDIDFDELDVPFRAIATHLHDGRKKVFEKGDLVEAILTSMAVPGLFMPREIDGEFYIDGGIASTLPIQTAQALGADIIIAIDVTVAPQKLTQNISLANTAQQITTFVVWNGLQKELKLLTPDDLYIRPNDQLNISTAAFHRSKEGLTSGKEIALNYKKALLEIKARAAPPKAKTRSFRKVKDFTDIHLINNTYLKDKLILNRYKNASGDLNNIRNRRNHQRDLRAFGGFSEVDLGHRDGQPVLNVSRNRLGRNLLRLGVQASHNFRGVSSYDLYARLTRRPLSESGGDISLEAQFGTDIGARIKLYQPFGKSGRYFFQPELYALWDQINFYILNENLGNFWVRNLGVQARLGREFGQWGILAFESSAFKARITDVVTAIPDFQTQETNRADLGLYFAIDTLNRTDWPTAGQRLRLRAQRAYDLDDTSLVTNRYEAAFLFASKLANTGILLNGRYGRIDSDNNVAGIDIFQLGGFRQLGGFPDNALPVTQFIYGSIELFRRLTAHGHLFEFFPLYVGVIGEYARVPLNLFEIDQTVNTFSGSLYFGADTPLGPIYLGTAYGDNDDYQIFIKFGRTF